MISLVIYFVHFICKKLLKFHCKLCHQSSVDLTPVYGQCIMLTRYIHCFLLIHLKDKYQHY